MEDFKFNVGLLVKDKVTGFKGIIRVRAQYLTGCNRYGIQSQELKDGKPTDWVWFDEDELITLKKSVSISDNPSKTGGPLRPDQYGSK
jgi:hypothetical protein